MTDALTIAELVKQFGTAGTFIGFLIWQQQVARKDREKEKNDEKETRLVEADAKAKLAASLAVLTSVLQHRGQP